MTIRLLTRDLGFVRQITVLPFILLPEVMVWGSRIFVRNIFADIIGKDSNLIAGYTEACMFSVDTIDASV